VSMEVERVRGHSCVTHSHTHARTNHLQAASGIRILAMLMYAGLERPEQFTKVRSGGRATGAHHLGRLLLPLRACMLARIVQ
jgi:hypothetical protein